MQKVQCNNCSPNENSKSFSATIILSLNYQLSSPKCDAQNVDSKLPTIGGLAQTPCSNVTSSDVVSLTNKTWMAIWVAKG